MRHEAELFLRNQASMEATRLLSHFKWAWSGMPNSDLASKQK